MDNFRGEPRHQALEEKLATVLPQPHHPSGQPDRGELVLSAGGEGADRDESEAESHLLMRRGTT